MGRLVQMFKKHTMRVLQINMTDMFSTGNIMLNIAERTRLRGHEAFTASKKTRMSLWQNRKDPFHTYLGTRIEHTIHRYFSWMTDLQDFGSILATYELIRKIKKIKPDIIHLHDIVGWYVNIGILFRFLRKYNKPIIWTFHDCWAFTGRCIYFDTAKCDRWETGCGKCPQISYMPKSWYFDLSAYNWCRKNRLFNSVENMTIVCPSLWLKELTGKSFLSKYRCLTINNGINLETFAPTTGDTYSKIRSLNKKIILGVASTWSIRKGLKDFIKLSSMLTEDFQIVLVGISQEEINCEQIIAYKRTTNQKELAEIYTAADVFANPTMEENFPTVNLEALACGTPIVTYRTGGSPESVDEKTGIVVEHGNLEQMKDAIIRVTKNGKGHYVKACIEKSQNYDMNARFNDYVDLYEEFLKQ